MVSFNPEFVHLLLFKPTIHSLFPLLIIALNYCSWYEHISKQFELDSSRTCADRQIRYYIMGYLHRNNEYQNRCIHPFIRNRSTIKQLSRWHKYPNQMYIFSYARIEKYFYSLLPNSESQWCRLWHICKCRVYSKWW